MPDNRNYYRLSALILLITSLFFFSCRQSIDQPADFGTPPTPGSCFCDPEGVRTYLEWITVNYPELTKLRIIGTSESGRAIYALELSDHPAIAENEPKVLINGSIHGNEQIATGIAMKLLEHLLQGRTDGNPETSYLINNFKIHFIPALNPDGLASDERYNSKHVDLNRNFGYSWDADTDFNGEAAFDQSESTAVKNDFSINGYCLSINLHTAVNQPNIGIYAPWDAIPTNGDETAFTHDYLPNYPFIKSIGEAYASKLRETEIYPFAQYFHYQEGADWYPFCGSMSDWAMGIHATLSYSIELYGDQHFTVNDSEILEKSWAAHKSALLDLIRTAELGSGGRVVDDSGKPIAGAEIKLSDNSFNSKSYNPESYRQLKSISDSEGLFRLLSAEGTYSITIEKAGYQLLAAELTLDSSGKTSVNGKNYQFFPEYILIE